MSVCRFTNLVFSVNIGNGCVADYYLSGAKIYFLLCRTSLLRPLNAYFALMYEWIFHPPETW